MSARRASPRFSVNTSLSRKLFFSTCWCIRDVVHFDSRVHAATKPSHTYIGGQHGQESEEGEEGEERSEEDCEEDEEGLQEEEVTRLEENAGGLMPATSQEPSAKFAFRSEF